LFTSNPTNNLSFMYANHRAVESGRNGCFMKRVKVYLPIVLGLCTVISSAMGQAPRTAARGNGDTPEKQDDATLPIPPETSSVTKHDWVANGQTIHYTATAGNLLINDDNDKPIVSMFYVAYTADGADSKTRPITFCYNGGPGSATIWLHMGSFGPVRVVTESPDATKPAPFELVTNTSSLIDKSDLVFIDAPMTGFSKLVGKGTTKEVAGVDPDIHAFEKFIIRYMTLNERWNSPKFLFGESYGTPRSAALVALLQEDGIEFNGVTLLSSILNYGVRSPGYDTQFIAYLPSYTAIAYYYKKGKHTGSMADAVEQAREFARGPYTEALEQGDKLPAAQMDTIAAKMSDLTGLSVEYLKETKLRVAPTRFRKELMRGDDRILGRYDARFEGWDVDSAGENPAYDPSDTGPAGPFVGAFHDYIERELKYTSTAPYVLSARFGQAWDNTHHPAGAPGGGGGGFGAVQVQPDTAVDLSDAMRKNPHLKIFSANGYFDLATPFFMTEYDLSHMMLPSSLVSNIMFGYYPSGHMVYLNPEAQKMMKVDLDRFYNESLAK
jgi:carboxypeptidase C (cathepsin A)